MDSGRKFVLKPNSNPFINDYLYRKLLTYIDMKKILAYVLALAGVMTLSTSCLMEEVSDVAVKLSVNKDLNAYFNMGSADQALAGSQSETILSAYKAALDATSLEPTGNGYWVARNQRSNRTVSEMVLRAGDNAYEVVKDIKGVCQITVTLSIDSAFGVETVADYSF